MKLTNILRIRGTAEEAIVGGIMWLCICWGGVVSAILIYLMNN